MKALLIVLVLATPAAALAQNFPAPLADGYHARLYERYCEKLREGPHEYVLFVRRLQLVHGYTYTDFAPAYQGAPVRADCRVSPTRVAAVHRALSQEKR